MFLILFFIFVCFRKTHFRTLVDEYRTKNGMQLTQVEKQQIKEFDESLPVVRDQQQEQRDRTRERQVCFNFF
jgi:hypothetical protein